MLHDSTLTPRIAAVLPYYDYPINRQLSRPKGQRSLDGWIDLHGGVPVCSLLEDVSFASLINVKRNHIHRGIVILTVPPIALKEPIHDMLRVKEFSIGCYHGRQPRTLGGNFIWSHDDP